ncbi:MAG: GWxTD domain-containing protein, partial [Candidatus Saccharicenans sp.]
MENKKAISLGLLVLFIFWAGSCAGNKQEKSLDSASEQFLSQVRYIITPEERNTFLQLPPSERGKFIEEFWKRRDPTPNTPENEFKTEYFRRIRQANQYFNERGRPGWLTDRGKVWIILGRPDEREIYPYGNEFYLRPVEIWYYRSERIIFVDQFASGQYELEPLSAEKIPDLTKQAEVEEEKGSQPMNFEVNLKKIEEGKGLISISLPYNQIWFKAEKEKFTTTLDLLIEIEDSANKKIWK